MYLPIVRLSLPVAVKYMLVLFFPYLFTKRIARGLGMHDNCGVNLRWPRV